METLMPVRRYKKKARKLSEKQVTHSRNLGLSNRGKKRASFSEETIRRMSLAKKGKARSEETRLKMMQSHGKIGLFKRAIYELWIRLGSYKAVGKVLGISPQRVGQIINEP